MPGVRDIAGRTAVALAGALAIAALAACRSTVPAAPPPPEAPAVETRAAPAEVATPAPSTRSVEEALESVLLEWPAPEAGAALTARAVPDRGVHRRTREPGPAEAVASSAIAGLPRSDLQIELVIEDPMAPDGLRIDPAARTIFEQLAARARLGDARFLLEIQLPRAARGADRGALVEQLHRLTGLPRGDIAVVDLAARERPRLLVLRAPTER